MSDDSYRLMTLALAIAALCLTCFALGLTIGALLS
jgi:hypothetical protein